ncbi:homocysteine S-methyltransferase [Streptococcus macacae]|uniref:S-methylmethionine:homocysteine methyltransferase n=1 Tax=Streptococcus macacae NCTC 11558 TaxID=764298 RepID=G5JU52_9STRE|nr:homocysteine S-methyltransferase [Streptococcus macacae]EHJ53031.1 homocysteine S-methyltransferase [Streptococcus macacae NCTC 11558]SUN78417.1 homocysteine methyltransferase [Streptococcus macacae NCTC 11558]
MGRFKELLSQENYLILHGALGTELEFLGYDVSGKLWSAKYLLKDPQLIQDIHETYLKAGSDIITSSSYQASVLGLCDYGLDYEEALNVIALTVQLAKKARENVWSTLTEKEKKARPYPLISGDVGPYAAYLADGSEYSGNYGSISKETLKDFHRPRLAVLVDEECDLLALETIPNYLEVQALSELLQEEFPAVEAYISFTAQTKDSISDGTAIEKVAQLVDRSPQILALGINCSSPLIYKSLLQKIAAITEKPLVTYPNSGEIYDGKHQNWTKAAASSGSLLENTLTWYKLGAKILGGCCRTRPADIKNLNQGLQRAIKKRVG